MNNTFQNETGDAWDSNLLRFLPRRVVFATAFKVFLYVNKPRQHHSTSGSFQVVPMLIRGETSTRWNVRELEKNELGADSVTACL